MGALGPWWQDLVGSNGRWPMPALDPPSVPHSVNAVAWCVTGATIYGQAPRSVLMPFADVKNANALSYYGIPFPFTYRPRASILNPVTGTWTYSDPVPVDLCYYGRGIWLAPYGDDRVLLGPVPEVVTAAMDPRYPDYTSTFYAATNRTLILNVRTGVWSNGPTMPYAMGFAKTFQLATGKTVVFNHQAYPNLTFSPEQYGGPVSLDPVILDPAAGTATSEPGGTAKVNTPAASGGLASGAFPQMQAGWALHTGFGDLVQSAAGYSQSLGRRQSDGGWTELDLPFPLNWSGRLQLLPYGKASTVVASSPGSTMSDQGDWFAALDLSTMQQDYWSTVKGGTMHLHEGKRALRLIALDFNDDTYPVTDAHEGIEDVEATSAPPVLIPRPRMLYSSSGEPPFYGQLWPHVTPLDRTEGWGNDGYTSWGDLPLDVLGLDVARLGWGTVAQQSGSYDPSSGQWSVRRAAPGAPVTQEWMTYGCRFVGAGDPEPEPEPEPEVPPRLGGLGIGAYSTGVLSH